MSGEHRPHDELGRLVAIPLQVGTLLAVVVIGVGLMLSLDEAPDIQRAERVPLFETIGAGGVSALTVVGLLTLTLVPIAMVGGALIGFARSGERRYLVASLVVLALLLGSVVVSAILLGA